MGWLHPDIVFDWKKIGQQLAPHAAPEGLDGGGQ
jgi:hypothetical protein